MHVVKCVVFDEDERKIIGEVVPYLGVHPQRSEDETIVMRLVGLANDSTPATHERLAEAIDILDTLVEQIEIEAQPEHWHPVTPADELMAKAIVEARRAMLPVAVEVRDLLRRALVHTDPVPTVAPQRPLFGFGPRQKGVCRQCGRRPLLAREFRTREAADVYRERGLCQKCQDALAAQGSRDS